MKTFKAVVDSLETVLAAIDLHPAAAGMLLTSGLAALALWLGRHGAG